MSVIYFHVKILHSSHGGNNGFRDIKQYGIVLTSRHTHIFTLDMAHKIVQPPPPQKKDYVLIFENLLSL
jgi:hypothetical protein